MTPRAYAGTDLAPNSRSCGPNVEPCDVSAEILFVGGKLRLMAPIPWVGPFIESGLGVSLGRISTRNGQTVGIEDYGFMYHIPLTLGVAIGPEHQFEFALQFLFHPEQRQTCGAGAISLSFPLDFTPKADMPDSAVPVPRSDDPNLKPMEPAEG